MRLMRTGIWLGLLAGSSAAVAQLEVGGDLLSNCDDINGLVSSGSFSVARDKTRLCLQGIEQELTGEVGQYFRTEISGWTRTSFDETQAMGFSNITATYEKGDIEVDVTLTGTSGGGGAAGGLGAAGFGGLLGGFATNALMQSGQQVTVAGLPSSLQPDGSLTVPLQDGSLLMFQSSDFDSADEALAGMGDLINEFPVADINAALQ